MCSSRHGRGRNGRSRQVRAVAGGLGRSTWLAALVGLGTLAGLGVASGSAEAQTIRQDFYATNGTVSAEALVGNTLYIGGTFTQVAPASGGWVPLDATPGLLTPGFPKVAGRVHSIASDGAGGW